MREAFLDCAKELKQLYEDGCEGGKEEEEIWELMGYYLTQMDDDEKVTILVDTIILWKEK